MAVTFQKIYETSTLTDLPLSTADTAQTNTYGINSGGGPVEFLILRGDVTFDLDPAAADIGNLLSSLRIVCNGQVFYDYRAGTQDGDAAACSPFVYFNNKIGGRCYEVPTGTTTREWYWAIPIGRQLPQGVNRWEIVLSWGGTATATANSTSGKLEWWLRMNDGMQVQTTVISPTSFDHTADTIQMVTVRVPQSINGVVSGILVQNNAGPLDDFGPQGIRVQALGPNGMEPQFWRWLNGDLENGIVFADSTNALIPSGQQAITSELAGQLLLPVFGLQGGDIILQVDTGAGGGLRTYTPIISQQINAAPEKQPRQTEQVTGNAARALLAPTKN